MSVKHVSKSLELGGTPTMLNLCWRCEGYARLETGTSMGSSLQGRPEGCLEPRTFNHTPRPEYPYRGDCPATAPRLPRQSRRYTRAVFSVGRPPLLAAGRARLCDL